MNPGTWIDGGAHHVNYKSGEKNFTMRLPVEGAENPVDNAIAILEIIDDYTKAKPTVCSRQVAWNSDPDLHATGNNATDHPLKLTFKFMNQNYNSHDYKSVTIPEYKFGGGPGSQNQEVLIGLQLEPLLRVFSYDDSVKYWK